MRIRQLVLTATFAIVICPVSIAGARTPAMTEPPFPRTMNVPPPTQISVLIAYEDMQSKHGNNKRYLLYSLIERLKALTNPGMLSTNGNIMGN